MKHSRAFAPILIFSVMSACSTTGLGKVKDGVMEIAGFAPKPAENVAKQEKAVQLRIFAGSNLNLDQRGRPMAMVVKLYQLRDLTAFSQASYDTLADSQLARAALASELLEVKEFVIKPGEDVSRTERLAEGATHFGVVALYRKAFPERWRMSFAVSQQSAGLIVLGAHACAMTVSRGVLSSTSLINMSSLGGVSCE